MDFDLSHYTMTNENCASSAADADDGKAALKQSLASNMLGREDASVGHRVLALSEKPPAAPEGYANSLKVLYSQSQGDNGRKVKSTRYVPSAPERILDAPDLVDDYYLNLLDWSSSNVLAVALGQTGARTLLLHSFMSSVCSRRVERVYAACAFELCISQRISMWLLLCYLVCAGRVHAVLAATVAYTCAACMCVRVQCTSGMPPLARLRS